MTLAVAGYSFSGCAAFGAQARGRAARAYGALAPMERRAVREPAAAGERHFGAFRASRRERPPPRRSRSPCGLDPAASPPPAERPARDLARPLDAADRDRRAPRPHRSGLERARSPVSWIGPERWYRPPLPLDELPPIDAVVISHDHYDHLDQPTILAMKDWSTTFVVPLGVGAAPRVLGHAPGAHRRARLVGAHQLGELEIVCTPARHASGRTLFDRDATLWAGYALLGPRHRVYFSGDTGLLPRARGDRRAPRALRPRR